MRRPGWLALLPALGACAYWAGSYPVGPAPPFEPAAIAADVAWLADDAREGRGLGSAGLEEAAGYLARGFAAAGLEPGAADGGYLQRFEMPVSVRVEEATLEVPGLDLERVRDFEAFAASASGEVEGELVFAGYGISDTRAGYDDYAELDVHGKVVLVLDDRPETAALGDPQRSGHLGRAYKLVNARRRGAAAVLLAPSHAAAAALAGRAADESLNPTVAPSEILGLGLSRAAAEELVAAAGADLAALQAGIERAAAPTSRPLGGLRARVAVRVERERGQVANVVAVLRGTDPRLAGEAVVVGAHYDHLGRGEFDTLAPDRRGEIHNGADDNASGAAGLLALARAFAGAPPTRRSLVLVGFTAEEVGLAGSEHYAESPAVPLERTVAMLDLDMVGRPRAGRVTVMGTETSRLWPGLLRRTAAGLDLELELVGDGIGPSDHTSFSVRGVPALLVFTGAHEDYHTPDDDAHKVDAGGEARVLELVYRTARSLLDAPRRPPASPPAARPAGESRSGYGPYLGTIPSFGGPSVRGVRIQGVREGSPAQRAGLRGGDVIVAFDGAPVANLEEFASVLYRARAGQEVEIVVERDGERVPVQATLGERR